MFDLGHLAKTKLISLKGEVQQIIYLMRCGEMDEFKSMEAIDAQTLVRNLREAADRIEAVAKDYSVPVSEAAE